MGKYVKEKSEKPTFVQEGAKGYGFDMINKNVEVKYVVITKGHDHYIISKDITHIYYILKGTGQFEINKKSYKVKEGDLIEVPPNNEYSYVGNMELLLIMNPPWYEGGVKITKPNEKVLKA